MATILSAYLEPLISRNLCYERLASALRLYVGRGRRYTVRELSEGAGIPERAIDCALYQPHQAEFRPLRLEYVLSLYSFLGAPFASHYLEVTGLGAFDLMDEQPPLPKVFNADSAKPAETPREKVERLQIELFKAIEELTA